MKDKPTETEIDQWYLVENTPGVDIRHKFKGQELVLVEHVNRQTANKIVCAVNRYDHLCQLLYDRGFSEERLETVLRAGEGEGTKAYKKRAGGHYER